VSAPARRELLRHMVSQGLSERRSLRVIGMSANAYRYEPTQGRNCALKEKIIALAQRHRRYGAGMIYLKLRQAGELVNHKRVDRLYAEAGLQMKKRRRKKTPLADRHPLERPTAANQVWSMDFVFDRTAEGRSIKSLTVVDDATHEAVAIVPERALGGNQLVRILEQLASTRGLPKAIRTDNVLNAIGMSKNGNSIPCRSARTNRQRIKSNEQVLQQSSASMGAPVNHSGNKIPGCRQPDLHRTKNNVSSPAEGPSII
jgi:putative transposase